MQVTNHNPLQYSKKCCSIVTYVYVFKVPNKLIFKVACIIKSWYFIQEIRCNK